MNGAPARLWTLACPQCEAHLTSDPLWSGSLSDVPDTPDEVAARDNVSRNTARSRDDLVALALAKIAGLPVAEFLGDKVGISAGQGTVTCASGHENFPTSKFCAECGAPFGDTASTAAPGTPGAEEDDAVSGRVISPGDTTQDSPTPVRRGRKPATTAAAG